MKVSGKMKKIAVTSTITLPFFVRKEVDFKYHVSCCPVLDIWSQGETEKRAVSNLIEATQLFLINCFERGTLEKVLKDCGFIAVKKRPLQKTTPIPKHINVPLPFIIDQQMARCRD